MMNRLFIFLFFISNTAIAQVDLTLGLKAYYPFSGNANDASGNNNNPAFNNATLAADRFGNTNSAYQFNGVDNYMRIPNSASLNPGNQISICAWVKVSGFYQGTCHGNSIVMKGDDDFLPGSYLLRFDDNAFTNGQNCSNPIPDIAHQTFYGVNVNPPGGYTPFIQTNQWVSVVYTNDGTTARVYVDCELKITSQTSRTFTNIYDLFLGKLNNPQFPYWFNGVMDEVRIYNRPLNQQEVNAVGGCLAIPCNNWLNLPSHQSYVSVGDLDIPGNKITVEATINRTQPYLPGTGNNTEGDVVSKHTDPVDINYLLRPNHAYITTTNGFFGTPDICNIELNKTYHLAMVYDGASLKLYRNGFLMSQVAATGNLFQNDLNTQIGLYPASFWNTQFLGYINEVRIWNVARTQTEIRTYMNSSLPNPATQTGLQAYYTFNDLLNKQGNPAWNGTLGGTASINSTTTNCNFFIDSCSSRVNIGNIINDYTPVLSLNPCDNKITVENAAAFNTGDTVLMIQMKGAVIDSTNTAAFGTVTNYRNAGNYEINYVKSKTGNIIELKNTLTRQYDIPVGKVQLVRVPYYPNANITSTLTCLPWDGNKGGILVLNVQDTVAMNANIDVTGKGLRGGVGFNSQNATLNCFQNNYHYPQSNNADAGQKGESISTHSQNINYGKGSPANGGGGGLGHNSGGGGGANGGAGGFGGYQLEPCGNSPFDNRGIGGHVLATSAATNRIFLGGGGGAGQADNPGNLPPDGGNGGGIILILSNYLKTNGNKILANGNNGTVCSIPPSANCHDAMGGGGAAGSILLSINQYLDNTSAENKGGKGADMIGSVPLGGRIGPGGGGSGGTLFIKNSTLPANLSNTNTGGTNGVLIQDANNPWGATPGQNGTTLFNLVVPVDNILFKPNIDSVRIKDSSLSCGSFDFKGFGYFNTHPITGWQWYFGDGGTANTQNTTHTYGTAGNYIVKLVVTDINGCKDSISKNITAASSLNFDFTYQQNTCDPLSVQFTGIGTSNQTPFWSFGDATTVSGITNPVHVYPATGNYIVKYSVANGSCTDTITKTITLSLINENIILTQDTTICSGLTKQLLTTPSLGFCWSPTTWLNDPNSPNPITSTPQNITYYFTAEVSGNNIITNGNFNNGNSGFTSQYNFANPNLTEGQYFVGPNPQAWNSSLSNCPDHTGGNGNMMLVNGSPTPDVKVWSQTITVTPNTNYAFSTWIQALWPPNPAQLKFSINNNDIGSLITASLPTCTWTQFYTSWNSGNSTTANISIVNKNTLVQGNDFALDDISFAPVLIKRDSVIITVENPVVTATNSTGVCTGTPVQLNASGASTYSWTPAQGLSNSNIANPVATPTATTQYIVTGLTANGCMAKDTVDITILAKPTITKSADTTICAGLSTQLLANGGVSYSWSPAATLNNASIPNPIAAPLATTIYHVIVTGANGCNNNDSIQVTLRSSNAFSITSPPPICINKTTQLNASGGHQYAWQPGNSLNDPFIANPTASPLATTIYTVQITDTVCNNTATLSTTVTVLPLPNITANKSNDLDCSVTQSQLIASGGVQYSWTPAASLDNPNSGSPIASPNTTTQYIVAGTTAAGCVNYDSVTVNVTNINKGGYLMPTGFTPNNDGLNDCYGIKYWGTILELEFSVYNRWGERIFYTTQPGKCWDGKVRGILQDPAVFVYMIRAKTICEGSVFRKGTFVLIR